MDYEKRIEICGDMVIAEVFRANGARVDIKFFDGFLSTIAAVEKRTERAHDWADELIALCRRREVLKVPA